MSRQLNYSEILTIRKALAQFLDKPVVDDVIIQRILPDEKATAEELQWAFKDAKKVVLED